MSQGWFPFPPKLVGGALNPLTVSMASSKKFRNSLLLGCPSFEITTPGLTNQMYLLIYLALLVQFSMTSTYGDHCTLGIKDKIAVFTEHYLIPGGRFQRWKTSNCSRFDALGRIQ